MFVENEKEWNTYRGLNPQFAKAALQKRQQAKREIEQAKREDALRRMDEAMRRRIEMLRAEAAQAKASAMETKRLRREREQDIIDRIALAAIREARTEFQWILAVTMRLFRVSRADLMGHGRNKKIANARQFVMYWTRRRTTMSYPQIGRLLGGKDHTTIYFGCKAYVRKRALMGRYLREVN